MVKYSIMYDIPGENDLVSAKILEKGESFQQWTKILGKIFVIQFWLIHMQWTCYQKTEKNPSKWNEEKRNYTINLKQKY